MTPFQAHAASFGLLIHRVAFGATMLLAHGWGKMMAYGELKDTFPDPIGLGSQISLTAAVGAEVVAAALVVVGLATRLAAIPLAFTMIVAGFVVHQGDEWSAFEPSWLFLIAFVVLVFTGPGYYSLDHGISLLTRRKSAKLD